MSRKYFGTDGIRGVANQKLTPELALDLGRAAGRYLNDVGSHKRVVIGRDTRRSGPMLGAALAAGFNAAGIDTVSIGVAPTPAVSYIAREGDFDMGIVISASHNPAPDNGIKLLGHDGKKLADETELRIENLMSDTFVRPIGANVGALTQDGSLSESYMKFLETVVPERLDGMKVAVDGAHGAAYVMGPEILRRLGAEVVAVCTDPNGMNINDHCGATHPERIQKLTKEDGWSVGVAFDGDADRAVFSDAQGRLINGDRLLGIVASYWQSQGELNPPVVVGTVMSNGGFEQYLVSKGITLERTPVGDKYVAQKIAETSARLGGEQSGHIIFPERQPTGDGLVTMLEFLRVLKRSGRTAEEFFADYDAWPQLLINVTVADRSTWNDGELVQATLAEAERKLVGHGRMNVRASGTQPMVRVMVEADNYALRDEVAESIVAAMVKEAGGAIYSRVDLTHSLGE